MRIDRAGQIGEPGDLDHRDARFAQGRRPATLDEQRRLQPGDHHPADPGRHDQLGAGVRARAPGQSTRKCWT